MKKSKHMNTAAAADYLGLSPHTLNRWRCEGRGPKYKKIGAKLIVYLREDLDNFITDPVQE